MPSLTYSHRRSAIFVIAVFALVASLLAATAATKAEAVGENSGGVFVPVTPSRIADTMAGTNTSATPIPSGGVRAINVLGVGGIPSTGVGAVVLDVAGSSNAGAAVYAYPDGTTRGGSFLKIDANDGWDSNTVIVKPGSNGKVAFYNSYGSTELNVDVQGYFTDVSGEGSPGGFVPITPSRILSTYAGIGIPNVKLKGGTTTQFQVGGVGDIPVDATAVFGNVRVFDSDYSGAAKILASNATVNNSYSINFVTDEFNDTGMSMKLGSDGKIKIILSGTVSDTAHLIIDIQGYFTPDPESGGSYTPLTQDRIFDSRSTVPIPANGSVEVPVLGHGGVPNSATVGSVAMSVLALDWHATGSVRVYNADLEPPVSTNLAFTAPYDRDVISTSVVELSGEGKVVIQNLSSGSVDIILDAQGWFSEPVSPLIDLPADDGIETAPDADPCASCDPLAVSGDAPTVISDLEVRAVPAVLDDETATEFPQLTLDDASVSIDGNNFTVRLDPTDVPAAYVSPEGTVDLQVMAVGPEGIYESSTSIQALDLSTSQNVSWGDPGQVAGRLEAPVAQSWPGSASNTAEDAARAEAVGEAPEDIADSGVRSDEFVQLSTVTPSSIGTSCSFGGVRDTTTRWATIGTTYPVQGSSARMRVTSSDGSDYQVAVSATGSIGTFSHSSSIHKGGGWSATWAQSIKSRSYQKQVKYGYYKQTCTGGAPSTSYHWRPVRETGGIEENKGITRPNWTQCAAVVAGTWTRNSTSGRSYTNSAGVSMRGVIGIDLSLKRAYSSRQHIQYVIGTNNTKLCGNNDTPATAGKIMQKFR